jgi:hypothetical protein
MKTWLKYRDKENIDLHLAEHFPSPFSPFDVWLRQKDKEESLSTMLVDHKWIVCLIAELLSHISFVYRRCSLHIIVLCGSLNIETQE